MTQSGHLRSRPSPGIHWAASNVGYQQKQKAQGSGALTRKPSVGPMEVFYPRLALDLLRIAYCFRH